MPPKQNEGKAEQTSKEEVKQTAGVEFLKWIKYPPEGRSEIILQQLNEQRKTGEFCDIQLKLSASKTVYAHKAVLATRSPYFEGMFSSAFVEATSGVVDMSHITSREDVLKDVINTFYGITFIVNEGNVSETINLATMLMLEDLKEACAKILNVVVNIRNATGLLQLSLSFDLSDLKEKVLPVVRSRFHDYVLLQDDIHDMSVEGFETLHSFVDTSFISRKSRYVEFILRWFTQLETEERACLLLTAIEGIKFKITKTAYKGFADRLEDFINHLDDANLAVEDKTRKQLKQILPKLQPADYAENLLVKNKESDEKEKKEDSDSELEEEPKRPLYHLKGARIKYYGPPTEKTGFTAEEKKNWDKAHEDMKERDQHRIWAAEWPLDLTNKLGTHDDPRRPKHIRREAAPEFHKTRKLRVKSEEELKQEGNLIEAVIVIAPSKDFLEGTKGVDGSPDDLLEICIYVPQKRAWYKISSLSASSVQKKFNQDSSTSMSRDPEEHYRRPRPRGSADSDSDSDDDDYRMAAMMDMYGPELPPEFLMMMLRHMPSSRRHRLMEEMMHGRIPPRELRHMLEMGMDDGDDMHWYEHMMMRESARRPRHMPFGMMGPMGFFMRDMGSRRRVLSVKPLTDKNWKVVSLKYRLYLYHQDVHTHVFCYDLETQEWFKSEINYVRDKEQDKYRENYADSVDGIELIVMGQVLHAVLRIAMVKTERDRRWGRRKEELIEEAKRQEVYVKHIVYRMTGDLDKAVWEKIMESEGHDQYIPLDKHLRIDPEKDMYSSHPLYGLGLGPMVRQPGGLKSFLYAEDEEKLYIITAVRKPHYRDETIIGYNISNVDVMYLDLHEREHLFDTPQYNIFLRNIAPLYGDDLVAWVDDEYKADIVIDLGKPGSLHRICCTGNTDVESNKEFLIAQDQYPRCQSITVSTGDGKNLWVLRGKDNDVSETVEVYATMCYQNQYEYQISTVNHPPPPFKCFTLAAATKIDRAIVKRYIVPIKYLHAD